MANEHTAEQLHLPQTLVDELAALVKGNVFTRRCNEEKFVERTKLFNGHMVNLAKLVVLPVDAKDVSEAIQFCTKNNLSLSIKAGGYGTAGWAIAGEVVMDLSLLDEKQMEAPDANGKFVPLRDQPTPNSKGKDKIGLTTTQSSLISDLTDDPHQLEGEQDSDIKGKGKRKRSPEVERKNVDTPLPSVATQAKTDLEEEADPSSRNTVEFLKGTSAAAAAFWSDDSPRPSIRRRLDSLGGPSPDGDEAAMSLAPQDGSGAIAQSSSSEQSSSAASNATHEARSVSPPTSPDDPKAAPSFPVENYSTPAPGPTPQSFNLSTAPVAHPDPFSYMTPQPDSYPFATPDPFGYMSSLPSNAVTIFSTPQSQFIQPQFPSMSSASAVPSSSSGQSNSNVSSNPTSDTVFLNERVPQLCFPGSGDSASASYLPATITPKHPYAYVTFGAGVKQKQVDIFTASNSLPAVDFHGNPCTMAYHVPFSAHPVGSSVMLLGGFGFLSRLHGLSIDALVEVEMVLADGKIIHVSENENKDLWWAIRGAGTALGVVTRYKAKAYPVPVVYAGNLIYKFRPSTAASLIKHFRDCVKGAPRELYANVLFTAGPAEKDAVIVVQICFVGSRQRGQDFLATISSWDGEKCLLNEVDEKSFLHQQESVAQILRGRAGRHWFLRSALVTSLPDEVIHTTVNQFANAPVGCTWLFELAGGAVAEYRDTCLPTSQREASFTIAAFHQWELEVDDPRCVSTAEEWISGTLSSVSTGGPYPSFLGRNENPSRAIACYGENWERLCEIKRKYDPQNLFKNTFWPVDIHGEPISARTHEPPSPEPMNQFDE